MRIASLLTAAAPVFRRGEYVTDEPIDWAEIYRIAVNDQTVERPAQFHDGIIDLSWSPDGAWLAYISLQDRNEELYRIRSNGDDNQRLTEHASSDYAPSWSPDGEWITLTSNRDGNPEIYRMRPDGSDFQRLTRDVHSDRKPVWSPDGEWIAFVSERDGNPEIYRIRPDGSDLQRLTVHVGIDDEPSWSRLIDLAWSAWKVGGSGGLFILMGLELGRKRRYSLRGMPNLPLSYIIDLICNPLNM